MFSRLNNQGNNYGPQIIFDKNSEDEPMQQDSLNFIAMMEVLGMNITWDGKMSMSGTNPVQVTIYL